jgi:AcrR family transcriptional regulator
MTAESVVRRGAGRPPRISRTEIFEAVLGLVDAEGLDAVSMRRVAALVSVQASSLYNHVSTKEELLDGAADQVVAGVDVSAFDTGDWLAALESWARSYHAALAQHPKMVPWFARGVRRGERSLRNADRVYGGIVAAGWSRRDATLIGAATVNLIYGAALGSFAAGFPDDPSAYSPALAHLGDAHRLRSHRAVLDRGSFELGLRLHIDGLERIYRSTGAGGAPALSRDTAGGSGIEPEGDRS